MKTFLRALPLTICFILIAYLSALFGPAHSKEVVEKEKAVDVSFEISEGEALKTEGLASYIGKSVAAVRDEFGQETRKDPSAYGFEWLIFDKYNKYLQIGIEDDHVVTIVAAGEQLDVSPFSIGMSVDDFYQHMQIQPEFNIVYEDKSYFIELSEEDMIYRPLISFDNGAYAMISVDQAENDIAFIQYFDAESLVKQATYNVFSEDGESALTQSLSSEEWQKVNEASESQLYSMIQALRSRADIPLLMKQPTFEDLLKEYARTQPDYLNKKVTDLSNEIMTGNLSESDGSSTMADVKFDELVVLMSNRLDAPTVFATLMSQSQNAEFVHRADLRFIGMSYEKNKILIGISK